MHTRKGILLWAVLLLCASVAQSKAFNLPDTGQTTCYDVGGHVISCPPPGDSWAQDGSYAINPMSFSDNHNGTVTDNNTGLMWQQQDDGNTYNWYQATGTANPANPNNQNVCGSLSLGGHTDWHLPSVKELMTIVNCGVISPNPAIDSTLFPATAASGYWSSTTGAESSDSAWGVLFSDGNIGDVDKGGYSGYVRCVRNGQLNLGDFIDNGNGTVTDRSTGLMWQQDDGGSMAWQDALTYCNGLSLAGLPDWRLPSIKELESIADITRFTPAINTTFFPDTHMDLDYCSSTTDVSSPGYEWSVDFSIGTVNNDFDKGTNRYVRCVRAGRLQLLGDMNSDGIIDISDVILELRMALQLDLVKPCSDINGDQSVDISDVILTLRMALALDPLRQCTV